MMQEVQKQARELVAQMTLEEKCFAIRGRNCTAAKFSHEPKTPKLPVEKHDTEPEPYGGLFAKYGVAAPGQHN